MFAAQGGLARSLYNTVASFVGLGRIAMSEMRRLGYDDRLASASVAAGGTLGIMIPPSIMLVVYGLMTETSIGELFIAGILPGIAGMLLYMSAVGWVTWRRPELGPRGFRQKWGERWRSVREVWGVVVLFGIVLGGLYIGLFEPTEAASVGAFGAIVLAVAMRRLNWRVLRKSFVKTALTTGMISSHSRRRGNLQLLP